MFKADVEGGADMGFSAFDSSPQDLSQRFVRPFADSTESAKKSRLELAGFIAKRSVDNFKSSAGSGTYMHPMHRVQSRAAPP